MRAVIQRVRRGKVSVDQQTVAEIGPGLVILLGIGPDDNEENARQLAYKISRLRIFEDDQGKMNRSVLDTGGQAIVVSQFTLFADTRKGLRPSSSERPDLILPALWWTASASCLLSRVYPLSKDGSALICW
jgi:D-tyrosyl-tRNA(Tyr) deacylase